MTDFKIGDRVRVGTMPFTPKSFRGKVGTTERVEPGYIGKPQFVVRVEFGPERKARHAARFYEHELTKVGG